MQNSHLRQSYKLTQSYNPNFTSTKNKENQQQPQRPSMIPKLTLKPIHSNQNYSKKGLFQMKRFSAQHHIKQYEQVELKINVSLMNTSSMDKKLRENKMEKSTKKITEMMQKVNEEDAYAKRNQNLLKVINNLQKHKNKQLNFLCNQFTSPTANPPIKINKKLQPLKNNSLKSISKHNSSQSTLDPLSLSIGMERSLIQKKNKEKKIKKRLFVKEYESQQSDYESEYDEDATPGPGNYNYEESNKKKQFRSKKDKFKHIFYSHIERFHEQQKSADQSVNELSITADMSIPLKTHQIKPSSTFISKTVKIPQYVDLGVPPPGYYNTRQTLENDIVKNILKSSNTNIFISKEPRQLKINGLDEPGPGQYNLDRKADIMYQQYNIISSAFKKKNEIRICQAQESKCEFIKMCEEIQVHQIHVKNQLDTPCYLPPPPPFLSGSCRFYSLKPCENQPNFYMPNQHKKVVNEKGGWSKSKQSDNRRSKDNDWIVGQGIGVGIYDISGGLKKSFNIFKNH